ncbi:MAG: ABC transporter ATP-binding protein, partial [Candidatus Bipolaricaulia bacterium]
IRTLLTQKELLLLDEPFGSLDAMTRGVLHRYLLQVFEDFRRTIIFVTHDLEEALLLSDRVYLLTSRPAEVKAVLAVPLPRPRERTDPGFIKLERELDRLVQEELHEAFSR